MWGSLNRVFGLKTRMAAIMITLRSRSIWHLVDSVATAISQSYGIARSRALTNPMASVRMKAQRDHLYTEAALLERELEIFRSQRLSKPSRQRPHFSPEQRAEIMQLAALRQWSAAYTARRFGLHENTIHCWKRALLNKHRAEELLGSPPWNRLHESVRHTVHEISKLCPERDFGTRSIARHMVRAGIQISRASVRRILEEELIEPERKGKLVRTPAGIRPHLLDPSGPHQVWHTDITEMRVLWKKFEIAAVMDGYSRKLLAIRAFARRPTTRDMNLLIKETIRREGYAARFLISDRGSQFRRRFTEACQAEGIEHVKSKVRCWQMNAKVERFFRTMKLWMRTTWMVPTQPRMQKRLEQYKAWYNQHRVHGAHHAHTPEDKSEGREPKPILYTARGGIQPEVVVTRQSARGDPKLFWLDIKVREKRNAA